MNRLTFSSIAACAALALFVQPAAIAQHAGGPPEEMALVLPARRSVGARAEELPALPPAADRVTPLTFDVVVQRKEGTRSWPPLRQTVSRTSERVHVSGRGREWLFERNRVDPRRVSGFLVDHAARAVIVHEESEIRNRLGLAGWAPVLMLGLDAGALRRLTPTEQMRTTAGVRFRKYASAVGGGPPSEIWWSEDQALPSAFIISEPGIATRVTVQHLRIGVEAERLERPGDRFPTYRIVDLAEWLEGH